MTIAARCITGAFEDTSSLGIMDAKLPNFLEYTHVRMRYQSSNSELHPLHDPLVVYPVFAYLDIKFQEDATVEKRFDVFSSLDTDILDHLASFADEDSLLRCPLHVNGGSDVDRVLLLVKIFDSDG